MKFGRILFQKTKRWDKLLTSLLPRSKPLEVIPSSRDKRDIAKLTEAELKNALNLLAQQKKQDTGLALFKAAINSESSALVRSEYVNQLSTLMNEINLPSDKHLPDLQKQHFNKIIDGLNIIGNQNRFINGDDGINLLNLSITELTKLIRNIQTSKELWTLFEFFYYTENLHKKIAIEFLLNKHIQGDLQKKICQLVLSPSGQRHLSSAYWTEVDFIDFEIAYLQKLFQIGDIEQLKFKLRYYLTNQYWLEILKQNKLSTFAERTFWKYCLLFNSSGGLTDLIDQTLAKLSTNSHWIYLEAGFFLPQKMISSLEFRKALLLKACSNSGMTAEQSILFKFLNNELVLSSNEEFRSILKISMECAVAGTGTGPGPRAAIAAAAAAASSTEAKAKTQNKTQAKAIASAKAKLISKLSEKLLLLQQNYPNFDLSELNQELDKYIGGSHVQDQVVEGKVIELEKLLGFDHVS